MSAHEKLLELCEDEIRAGRAGAAAKRLAKVNTAKIPRAFRLRFANMGRRTGMPSFGLRVLTPIVRDSELAGTQAATPKELAEYAVLLQRCGAVVEAMQTLAPLDASDVPEKGLFEAYCLFNLWRYRDAILPLEKFLSAPPTEYLGLVGRVNLAAALVFVEDYPRALGLIEECATTAKASGYARLFANAHELAAQVYLGRGELSHARASLDLASAGSSQGSASKVHDQLFLKKWRAVLMAYENGSVQPLQAFRAEALLSDQPEAIRDTDFHALRVTFDERSFEHLYFGTPFADYRTSIAERLGREPTAERYVLGNGPRILDLANGKVNGSSDGTAGVAFGSHLHKLLEALLRDFYRPQTIGNLFAELHPESHFDIFSSPTRVRKALMRARRYLADSGLAAEIRFTGGGYKLEVRDGFGVIVDKARPVIDRDAVAIEKLRLHFGTDATFTTEQACSALGVSLKEFRRLRGAALGSGRLDTFGAGPRSAYLIPASRAG